VDNTKRYAYSFVADQTQNIWYDTSSVKPEEIRSYDNLLDLKWKGRIGFLDPRTPGSGASMWSFLWQLKGEEYLKKLVGQQLVLGRDQRLLAENLAKGKVSLTIGLSFYSFVSFIKAGLPVRALPNPKEGTYVSSSSGNVVVLKSAPHPNGAKLFVNWLLSKEGQEVFSKALGQGTRRLDVDTKWLKDIGVHAAKDTLTLDEYYQLENQSENKVLKIRKPAAIVARNLLD
jgi:iron(III) transport system substrate-binding protein